MDWRSAENCGSFGGTIPPMADYGTRNSTKEACRMVFCTLQDSAAVPKPRRQRHGLWTRSHAALALTLRALSVRAERKVLVKGVRSTLLGSFLPAGIIRVRWMAWKQNRIAHSSVWRLGLSRPRKDQSRLPC